MEGFIAWQLSLNADFQLRNDAQELSKHSWKKALAKGYRVQFPMVGAVAGCSGATRDVEGEVLGLSVIRRDNA